MLYAVRRKVLVSVTHPDKKNRSEDFEDCVLAHTDSVSLCPFQGWHCLGINGASSRLFFSHSLMAVKTDHWQVHVASAIEQPYDKVDG